MKAPQRHLTIIVLAVLTAGLLCGCSGPDEKKMKFLNQGKTLFEKGDYVRARLEFKNALQIDPKFAQALFWLGKVEMEEKDLKNAFQHFKQAVELDPGHLEARLQYGRMLLAGRMLAEAREQVDAVLAKDPRNREARLLSAGMLVAEKKPAEAAAVLEALRAEGHTDPSVFTLLAGIYSKEKPVEAIEAILEEGIAVNPESTGLNTLLARLYLGDGRTAEARAVLARIIELNPDNPGYRINLANVLWQTGDTEAAHQTIEAMVAAAPDKEDTWLSAVGFYLAKKMAPDAERMLLEGIGKNPGTFRLRFVLSELYLQTRRADSARDTLENCLQLSEDPNHPDILSTHNRLAAYYLSIDDKQSARSHLKRVIDRSPNDVDANLLKGRIHLMEGEAGDAVAAFRTVANEKPELTDGHLYLARAHALNKEMALAEDTLKKAVDLSPRDERRLMALARLQFVRKDVEATEKTLRRVVEIHGNSLGARAGLGDFLLGRERYDEALAAYEAMVRINPREAAGYLKQARLFALQKKRPEAIAALEQGYAADAQSPRLISTLVGLYIQSQMQKKAHAICGARIAANDKDALAHYLQGQVFASEKRYDKAEASLERAANFQPDWSAPRQALTQLYLATGKAEKAVERLTADIAADPKNENSYLMLGKIHQSSGEHEKAATVYADLLEVQPANWVAANNLAFLLSERSGVTDADLNRAKQLAETALKLRPKETVVVDTLAWIHYKKGDYDRAAALLEEVTDADQTNPVISYHLGMAYYRAGRREEAAVELAKAVKTDEKFDGRQEAADTLKKLESS